MSNKILITGGAGFIGINFVKYLLSKGYDNIVVVDKLSYVSNSDEIKKLNVDFYGRDILYCEEVFARNKFDVVFHFAAESHVDNSIKSSVPFVYNNILGTVNLLKWSVRHNVSKFFHISTDEVFGSILDGSFYEDSKINPKNPYSASKASAEHFVRAYNNTYGLPYQIVNMSNNYGPFQYPEKLIPLAIKNCILNKKIPVYGQGKQKRDWIYVEDSCDAVYNVHMNGMLNETYCIGGEFEIENIEVIRTILKKMNLDESMIEYVDDRPGHDFRYSTNINKLKSLNWNSKFNFNEGIDKTIEWIKSQHVKF